MSDKLPTVIDVDKKTDFPLIPINPLDLPNDALSMALSTRLENRKLVLKIIKSQLKSGVDYGSIPLKKGAFKTKPTLFKSGGEKIISFLGLTARYPAYHEYEKAALNGLTLELIVLRCELHDGLGRVVSEGIGARNLNQDYSDFNKSIKMASKSSMLSSVLNLGFSELFTVDLEDMADAISQKTTVKLVSPEQLEELNLLINDLGLDRKRVESYCVKLVSAKGLGVINSLSDLPVDLYEFVLNKLPDLAERSKVQAEAA
jgi:hypothetical protein